MVKAAAANKEQRAQARDSRHGRGGLPQIRTPNPVPGDRISQGHGHVLQRCCRRRLLILPMPQIAAGCGVPPLGKDGPPSAGGPPGSPLSSADECNASSRLALPASTSYTAIRITAHKESGQIYPSQLRPPFVVTLSAVAEDGVASADTTVPDRKKRWRSHASPSKVATSDPKVGPTSCHRRSPHPQRVVNIKQLQEKNQSG